MTRYRSKYSNKKVILDGISFDSKREAVRWTELRLMEKAHEISNLERQVEFVLLPPQTDPETGKHAERAVKYVADFVYNDKDGKMIVEDTKGFKTKDYIIKRKLMLYHYGVKIREV